MRIIIDKEDLLSLEEGFAATKIVNGEIVDIVLHKNTQSHIHFAGRRDIEKDIDKCRKCGLDIRDDIHIKIRPQEANMI